MTDPKSPNLGGRPTKLTADLQKAICAMLRKGLPFELACEANGVHRATGYEWRKRGEGRDKNRKSAENYARFADACRKAKADGAAHLASLVFEGATGKRVYRSRKTGNIRTGKSKLHSGNILSAQWLLSRRFPEFFGGGRESITVSAEATETEDGEGKKSLRVDVLVLPDDPTDAAPAPATPLGIEPGDEDEDG